ncbi:unnamed protein product [Ranitomeya imitator]|uniref:Uncharacterized protein n=1 Tax=Ranitomeya imitator TaxID=111125 RepID=A0ABN9MC75_9NEOB|nr:unnamed protein product [Ranitomeya imitator]
MTAFQAPDYINANYIKSTVDETRGNQPYKVYIATQGCLQNTVCDFWSMVYQENTHVIVMTTKEMERSREEPPRRIWHYQYLSWPDHGVPNEPGGVLSFLGEINAAQQSIPGSGPIVVHCSAGIGRTGTIIVIDLLVDVINRQGLDCDIDIPKTIQMVRQQRSGMVQTEAQYKFIYMAVQKYIESRKKYLEDEQRGRTMEREYSNIHYPIGAKLNAKAPPVAAPSQPRVSDDSTCVYQNLNIRSTHKSSTSNAGR